MNTGIQDAINLTFKLNRVLRHSSPVVLLDDYEKQRKPVAQKVLRGTDLVFKLALRTESAPMIWIRSFLLPKIVRTAAIQSKVAQAISEVSIAKREHQIRENEKNV